MSIENKYETFLFNKMRKELNGEVGTWKERSGRTNFFLLVRDSSLVIKCAYVIYTLKISQHIRLPSFKGLQFFLLNHSIGHPCKFHSIF